MLVFRSACKRANKKDNRNDLIEGIFSGYANAAVEILHSSGFLLFCFIKGKIQKIIWVSLLKNPFL